MKKQLKEITNLTINDLLNNDIILPSRYFEAFNENASKIEVNIEDEDFNSEISQLIIEEYKTIDEYMNCISSNISLIKDTASDAKNALLEKDVEELGSIYKRMQNLEKDIDGLNKKLYQDETTNTYNRKWIYNKFLDKKSCFKKDGIAILVDISDFEYIKKEYGELISNNLILFATKFIQKNLKEEKIDFDMARFFDNKILIFCENQDFKELSQIIFNLQKMLESTTLKNNSGLMIKTSYKFAVNSYIKDQDSKELFEKLFEKLKEL